MATCKSQDLLSTRDGSVYGNNVDSEVSAVRLRSAAAGGDP